VFVDFVFLKSPFVGAFFVLVVPSGQVFYLYVGSRPDGRVHFLCVDKENEPKENHPMPCSFTPLRYVNEFPALLEKISVRATRSTWRAAYALPQLLLKQGALFIRFFLRCSATAKGFCPKYQQHLSFLNQFLSSWWAQ
jgi:hypothetical protein